jgi:predicted  nucleic acid-binding Zn-ribbon protein
MLSELFTLTNLYIGGVALVTVLLIIFILSAYYYWRAKEIAPFLARLDDLQHKIAEAQNTLEETKKEHQNKLDDLAKADRLIADGNAAKEWLENHRTEVETLQLSIDRQKIKLGEASEKFQKREEELSGLTQLVADKHGELKRTEELKATLDVDFSEIKEKIKVLSASINQKIKKEQDLTTSIDQLRNDENELNARVKDLSVQAQRLIQLVKEKKEELDHLNEKVDTAQTQLATVKGEAIVAQTTISQLAATQNANKELWKDLDRKLFVDAPDLQPTERKETLWLESFSSTLHEYGFIFDKRIVYAFHTGLKCAEISPLVVLSGISGTGKSLLPELYSASLCMNFLPVAVQPRWDSPQDMFGFYNYMEGRYKATELSRLLWQFDKYNNEEAGRFYQNNIPLNLVLLDEMNLARVEYYFSDLLSKLEIRNGLDPAEEEYRKKAEIEVECNASADNKLTRRLFVGLNNLFIGTMNEDESTQTLSDKVLDRSNVIRFGQPKQLATTPDKNGFLRSWRNKDRITLNTWTRWCSNELSYQDKKHLSDILKTVNTALAKIERPFGHRVSQAIERYVTYYPGKFTEGLSDQIEMKILPKLNGLDSQHPGFDGVINEVKSIIDELNDTDLLNTFEKSSETAKDSFFRWPGVVR